MKNQMTKYAYYFEMANLCNDLAKAYLEFDGEKSVDADIYFHAKEGFEHKIRYMSVDESSRPLSEERYKRLEDFRWFVRNKQEAAKRHREQANEKDADSAGA